MAFYFAIVSCSALGFISAFADDQYGLKGKNVSVLENVEVGYYHDYQHRNKVEK